MCPIVIFLVILMLTIFIPSSYMMGIVRGYKLKSNSKEQFHMPFLRERASSIEYGSSAQTSIPTKITSGLMTSPDSTVSNIFAQSSLTSKTSPSMQPSLPSGTSGNDRLTPNTSGNDIVNPSAIPAYNRAQDIINTQKSMAKYYASISDRNRAQYNLFKR